jgi:hypothetical protein
MKVYSLLIKAYVLSVTVFFLGFNFVFVILILRSYKFNWLTFNVRFFQKYSTT